MHTDTVDQVPPVSSSANDTSFVEPVTSGFSLGGALIGERVSSYSTTDDKSILRDSDPGLLKQLEEEAEKALAENTQHAAYSIEVIFRPKSTSALVECSVQVFRKNNRLHGAGDELMFFCRAPDRIASSLPQSARGCGKLFEMSRTFINRSGKDCTICPHCSHTWIRANLSDIVFYRIPQERLASVLTNYVTELKLDADIVLSRPVIEAFSSDIDKDMRKNTGRINDKMVDQAQKSASGQKKVCFGASRMRSEVGAGRTVESTLLAFLRA